MKSSLLAKSGEKVAAALLLSSLLSGCKVGPDYYRPDTEMPLVFNEDRPERTFVPSDEDLIRWWTTFDDPLLDELLEEAILGNFDYLFALEQVYQARKHFRVAIAQILPEIDSDAQASRFRTSQAFHNSVQGSTLNNPSNALGTNLPVSPIQNFFQAGFDAVWEIDLFGKLRRNAAAAYDTYEAQYENSRAVKITVLSEVANIYVSIRNYQQKIDLTLQTIELEYELLEMSSGLQQSGLGNEQDVETLKASLASQEANLQTLETFIRQNIYSLAVLLGRNPESLTGIFETLAPIPSSTRIPAGIPGDLLLRRPDIRASERQLASATEQIGVAVADLYPSISLIGSSSSFAANPLQGANIGWSSDRLKELFSPAARIWGIGTLITWPVFDWGMRVALVDIQWSIAQQAYYNYRKTVITALQEVEQSLAAYFFEEKRYRKLTMQTLANKNALDLIADLYQSGLADYNQVLTAKNIWLASANLLSDSRQALTSNLIAVYKAIGGDW